MNKRKLILTSGVANTFEWYDYALFGIFAPIIGQKFFPASDPEASLLHAFLAFAIGYLMRPIGGIFFGVIGDKFGRRVALSSSVICMAIPTAAIGFLPSYETMGIFSTSLMIVVRMLQGLSMGGALTGSISFVVEHTSKQHRGVAASISMSSICIGILLGSMAAYLTKISFSPEQFNEWGWRLPFIFGIFIFFAGLYIRNYTDETPLFKDAQNKGEIAHSPLREVLSQHWRDLIISMLINATGSIIFYFEAIYLMTYLRINRGFDEGDVVSLINICYVIMAVVTVLVGWLSDKINRRKIFIFNLMIIICGGPVIMTVLQEGNFFAVCLAQVALAVIAAAYIGPEPALQAEFYPTNIRNTALSVSYNAATSIFGGTAPYIIQSLVQNTGRLTASTYYIITSALLSLGALYFYQDRSVVDRIGRD